MPRLALLVSIAGTLATAGLSPALAGRLHGAERIDCGFCAPTAVSDQAHYVSATMRHRYQPYVFNETSRGYGRFDIEGIRLMQRMR